MTKEAEEVKGVLKTVHNTVMIAKKFVEFLGTKLIKHEDIDPYLTAFQELYGGKSCYPTLKTELYKDIGLAGLDADHAQKVLDQE